MRFLAKSLVLSFVLFNTAFISVGEARRSKQPEIANAALDPSVPDYQILKAMNNRRMVNFVEGAQMTVVKLLPDDTNGLEHQKWVVKLSDGRTMQAVYNLDMCEHVPLKEGDVVAMGGQFIWTNQGGMLHWLHKDPAGRRPDGYVELDGKFFCK